MKLTLSEYIDKEKARLEALLADKRPLYFAAQSVVVDLSERIFTKGQSVSGGTFQYVDSPPMYINPKKAFGSTEKLKPPRGKTGETKFKNGKPHKTTYVSSYKALRGIVGREDSFVNWEATGELKLELENKLNNKSAPITPKTVNANEYKISAEDPGNTGKLKGLIEKYPGVFQLSPTEKETFYRVFNKELLKLIRTGR